MTWFRVDDKFAEHAKVRRLAKDRVAAVGVWTMCGVWSADNLSDGFVPVEVVRRYDPRLRLAKRLVEVTLWREVTREGEYGYEFHQWSEHQPTRDEVITKREKTAKKVRDWRAKQAAQKASEVEPEINGDEARNPVTNPVSNPPRNPAPDPTRPVTTSPDGEVEERRLTPPRADVEQLCARLHEKVTANGVRATITEKWRSDARLLLDRDHRPLDQALRLVDWSTSHHFWHRNILSMSKFRQRYDRLLLDAKAEHQPRPTSPLQRQHRSNTDDNIRAFLGATGTDHSAQILELPRGNA